MLELNETPKHYVLNFVLYGQFSGLTVIRLCCLEELDFKLETLNQSIGMHYLIFSRECSLKIWRHEIKRYSRSSEKLTRKVHFS